MNLPGFIFQDWAANKGNLKGRCFMVLFRLANICSTKRLYFFAGLPYLIIYKLIIQWLFTLEIPWNLRVGRGLAIYHGQAIIINKDVVIGDFCTIRHCTTIGIKKNADGTSTDAPKIGNHVDIGNNVCIIGPITIGNNAVIGSGAVVVKSFCDGAIAVGNPAKDIKKG